MHVCRHHVRHWLKDQSVKPIVGYIWYSVWPCFQINKQLHTNRSIATNPDHVVLLLLLCKPWIYESSRLPFLGTEKNKYAPTTSLRWWLSLCSILWVLKRLVLVVVLGSRNPCLATGWPHQAPRVIPYVAAWRSWVPLLLSSKACGNWI